MAPVGALVDPFRPGARARRFVLSNEREHMERPNHDSERCFQRSKQSRYQLGHHRSPFMSASSWPWSRPSQRQLKQELLDINASVDRQKAVPKAPPPPPPDLVRPPPTAVRRRRNSSSQRRRRRRRLSRPRAPRPPPPPPPTELKAIARTHTIPPYPPISQRLGEQGTIALQGAMIVTEASRHGLQGREIVSGSTRLDDAACEYVKGHWTLAAADAGRQARRGHHPGRLSSGILKTLSNLTQPVAYNLYQRSEKMISRI